MASLSTPVANLLGLTIIGVLSGAGLYFGLRARGGPATPGSTQSSPVAISSTESTPVANAQPPPVTHSNTQSPPAAVANAPSPAVANAQTPPGTDRAGPAGISDAIKQSFESQRAKVVKECWEPEIAANPDPPKMKVTFDITYDSNGHGLARSIMEAPDHPHTEVTHCLQRVLETPTIAPPGGQVRVRVPFSLP